MKVLCVARYALIQSRCDHASSGRARRISQVRLGQSLDYARRDGLIVSKKQLKIEYAVSKFFSYGGHLTIFLFCSQEGAVK